jgi:uncharacterized membrane protein YbhN (UPF0104 family)
MSTRESTRPDHGSRRLGVAVEPITSVSALISRKAGPAWGRWSRLGITGVAAVAVVALLVSQRSLVASSLRTVGNLKWVWLLGAVGLEAASMASFAHMQCRLLRSGTTRVGLRPVLTSVFAGNALSATVPVAGSQMSLVFVFRRFKQLGVEATVAAWTLVVAGVISSLASAILLVAGAILTGNDLAAAAFANWLADAGVLAASLAGVGAAVPWRGLLFAYAVGTAVQGLGIVPGGIGVVEGALTLALSGEGVRHPLALAAVLVYRIISFWMVISVGWVAYVFVGGPKTAKRPKLALSDGWAA